MKPKLLIPKLLVGALSFMLTAIIALNTYEVVFSRDVPVASSIVPSNAQSTITGVVRDFEVKTGVDQNTANSKLGVLKTIEIPAIKVRVQLEDARRVRGRWYGRPSFASYIGLNRDDRQTTVDYLIYAKESWRTFPEASRIEVGMDVNIYSEKNTSSLFSVASVSPLKNSQSLTVSKTERRQIVLIIEDPSNGSYTGYSLIQGT